MSVENTTGGDAGAVKPAGDGAPANAPSISIDELVESVATKLLPKLSEQVTGMGKRYSASLKEEITAMLKGNADTPKDGDDASKVNPDKVKVAEVNERLKTMEAAYQREHARAIKGLVEKAIADSHVTASARELLVTALSAQAREDEQGNLYIGPKDSEVPLKDYLANFLKGKDDLLEATARPGSGAGTDKGGFSPSNMPKTQAELMWSTSTDAAGRSVVSRNPAAMSVFIAQYGQEAFDALPKGARPAGRDKL
jgi:hypothetical protein